MSDMLQQFRSVPLALAAYNAGPGAVAPCMRVPAYPETRAYVARILALLDGAGAMLVPPLGCGWWTEPPGRGGEIREVWHSRKAGKGRRSLPAALE